jgi:hypothetical protein
MLKAEDYIRSLNRIIIAISGHLDTTEEEFKEHYIPLIDKHIDDGDVWFCVGDARGTDTMAQKYLFERKKTDSRILLTIYHMFEKPRNNIEDWPCRGGFKTDESRDACMTADSHFDIAWIRPGRENSGTAKNLKRRSLNNI